MWKTQIKYGKKKGIKEAAGKITGKEERPQRKSCFDEECQIMLEDNKTA